MSYLVAALLSSTNSTLAFILLIGAVLSFRKVILQSVLILALTQSMFQGSEDPFSHLQNFLNSWSTSEQPGPLIVLPNINASAQVYPNPFRFDIQHTHTSQAPCPISFQPHLECWVVFIRSYHVLLASPSSLSLPTRLSTSPDRL